MGDFRLGASALRMWSRFSFRAPTYFVTFSCGVFSSHQGLWLVLLFFRLVRFFCIRRIHSRACLVLDGLEFDGHWYGLFGLHWSSSFCGANDLGSCCDGGALVAASAWCWKATLSCRNGRGYYFPDLSALGSCSSFSPGDVSRSWSKSVFKAFLGFCAGTRGWLFLSSFSRTGLVRSDLVASDGIRSSLLSSRSENERTQPITLVVIASHSICAFIKVCNE